MTRGHDTSMILRPWILVACVGLAAFEMVPARAQPPLPALECPQPRFTGSAPPEYLERRNPLPPDADTSPGRRLFQGSGAGISCAKCHGEKGDGRGPMSGMFDPRPRNFACAATVNGIPDGQLFWIIRFGSPGTSMPPHPKLTDDQIWQVVAYVRRLAR
jgi:mono/diheme cytochrome c family protein